MELIKNWFIGVTCAAMLVAVADSLTPEGAVKKLGKLTGGIVLLLAVLHPLIGLDYETFSLNLTENRSALSEYSEQEATDLNTQLMKTIIVEKTGAYILDKANALGADCTAAVVCDVGEDDLPYPVAVTVTGKLTESQREALSREIEAELAIPPEMQTFEEGDVE